MYTEETSGNLKMFGHRGSFSRIWGVVVIILSDDFLLLLFLPLTYPLLFLFLFRFLSFGNTFLVLIIIIYFLLIVAPKMPCSEKH